MEDVHTVCTLSAHVQSVHCMSAWKNSTIDDLYYMGQCEVSYMLKSRIQSPHPGPLFTSTNHVLTHIVFSNMAIFITTSTSCNTSNKQAVITLASGIFTPQARDTLPQARSTLPLRQHNW